MEMPWMRLDKALIMYRSMQTYQTQLTPLVCFNPQYLPSVQRSSEQRHPISRPALRDKSG
jgi:hypothetical protein